MIKNQFLNLIVIKVGVVRTYISERKSHGAAASTINKEIGLLSSALNYAHREWGWEVSNPVRGNRVREPEGRIRWLSHDEALSLVDAAREEKRAPHLADFIVLALNSGMRKGELLGLEWRRIDLNRNLLYLEARHTKSNRRRSIPLNHFSKNAILNRARFRATHCPDSEWVFSHKDGKRINDVKTAFKSACRRADISDFRIYDLRHTCAAWLVQSGVQLDRVRDLLGHRSVETTEIYAHLAPHDVKEAIDLLTSSSHLVTLFFLVRPRML